MAGFNTSGHRPSQTLQNVQPLNPASIAVDPNLVIRGFRDGFKLGSDTLKELDQLSLRQKALADANAALDLNTAKSQSGLRVLPSAEAAEIAKAGVVTGTAPGQIAATNAQNDSVSRVLPVQTNAALRQLSFNETLEPAAHAIARLNAGVDAGWVDPLPPLTAPVEGNPGVVMVFNRKTGVWGAHNVPTRAPVRPEITTTVTDDGQTRTTAVDPYSGDQLWTNLTQGLPPALAAAERTRLADLEKVDSKTRQEAEAGLQVMQNQWQQASRILENVKQGKGVSLLFNLGFFRGLNKATGWITDPKAQLDIEHY